MNSQSTPTNLTFAERAAIVTRYGIPVIPLRPRQKRAFLDEWHTLPTIDADQIAKWDKENPKYNCGAVGRKGEYWILDVDSPIVFGQIEKDTGHNLDEIDTLVVCSSGEKRHYYFRHNSRSDVMGNASNDDRNGELFSVRAHNEYVVSVGSIHPETGQPYEVVTEPTWGEIPTAPGWLLDWLLSFKKQGAKSAKEIPEIIPEGSRNKTLTSLAGAMRRKGASETAILAALRETNHQCQPPLPDDEVKAIAKSVAKYAPADTKAKAMPADKQSTNPCEIQRAEIVSVMASDVVPMPIDFLWEPYLQTGALNAYYGNPSVGKGHTSIDNIACLTKGRPFPTESTTDRRPMNCVILAAEEGVADTIVPRLMAAKADLKRVRIVRSIRYHGEDDKVEDRLITFQRDIEALKADLLQHPDEKFLLVDPITNYVGDINFNQDGEVRPVLTLLVQLAEELKITILIVGHFNKNTNVASALDKPGGGRAWTAVPRAVWGFFRHRENKQQRVMVNLKLNNAKESDTGLLFTIGGRVIGKKTDGKPWEVGYIEWGDKTDVSADEIIASEHPEVRRDSKGIDFLNDALKGRVRRATDVYKDAEAAQVSESTLKRASGVIRVLKFKMHDGWFWQHPDDCTPIPETARELNKDAQVRRTIQKSAPSETIPPSQEEPDFGFMNSEAGSHDV